MLERKLADKDVEIEALKCVVVWCDVVVVFFFFTLSTLVLLGATHVPIKTVQWSRSSAALVGLVHRLSGPGVVLILGQVKR